MLEQSPTGRVSLSAALGVLAEREQYLAMIQTRPAFRCGREVWIVYRAARAGAERAGPRRSV